MFDTVVNGIGIGSLFVATAWAGLSIAIYVRSLLPDVAETDPLVDAAIANRVPTSDMDTHS